MLFFIVICMYLLLFKNNLEENLVKESRVLFQLLYRQK